MATTLSDDTRQRLRFALGSDQFADELSDLLNVTSGTAEAGKSLVPDSSLDLTTGPRHMAMTGELKSTGNVGAKNGATVSVVETGDGLVHKTVLTCTAMPITMGDEGAAGQWGGTKVYDFPVGLILTLGAVIDGSITTPVHDHASGGSIATWDGDIALATAAPVDHASGISAGTTFLQSTAVTQAIAQVANVDAVSVATALTEAGSRWLDGTASAIDAFLCLLMDDSANNDAHEALFTGVITIVWINLGDK